MFISVLNKIAVPLTYNSNLGVTACSRRLAWAVQSVLGGKHSDCRLIAAAATEPVQAAGVGGEGACGARYFTGGYL